jgi:F0F1-type ATP synthase epsilon subunit
MAKTAQQVTAEANARDAAAANASKDQALSMHVKVYSPFKIYFDGTAQSISAVNDTGPFDILPQHHNFMTLLNPCEVVVRTATTQDKLQINKGIMHVKADQVIVFLDV